MVLKSKRYLSASNENCEVSVEGAFINMKLIIGNRELVPCSLFEKTCGIYQNCRSGTGNRELVPCSLFGYILPMFQKCKSGIRNQFLVPF